MTLLTIGTETLSKVKQKILVKTLKSFLPTPVPNLITDLVDYPYLQDPQKYNLFFYHVAYHRMNIFEKLLVKWNIKKDKTWLFIAKFLTIHITGL